MAAGNDSIDEIEARLRHRVGAADQQGIQAGGADGLHTAVGHLDVAGAVVEIRRPRPAGAFILLPGLPSAARRGGAGCNGDVEVVVAGHGHLRIIFRGVTADEVADFGDGGGGRRIGTQQVGRYEVGGRTGRVDVVRRTDQHLGRAQLIGQDLKNHAGTESESARGGNLGGLDDVFLRAAVGARDGRGIFVTVVAFPEAEGQADLLEIVDAADFLSLLFGGRERRQQHGRKNGDDGDDNKEFDKRERFF